MDINQDVGSSRHVLEVIKEWAQEGHLIYLFSPRLSKSKRNFVFFKKVYIPVINLPNVKRLMFEILTFFSLLFHFFKREGQVDFVYNREDVFSFSSIVFAKLFGLRHVTELNGILREEMKMNQNSSLQIRLSTKLEKLNYKWADKIICVTYGIKEDLINTFQVKKGKTKVIPNGVDIKRFYPFSSNFLYENYDIGKQNLIIGFVGTLFKWQGVDILIRAIPDIINNFKEVKFVIVGEGKEYRTLLKLLENLKINEYVVLAGKVPYEKIPWYINNFDICVAPFTRERNARTGLSPLKIYEYLACGKPVVTSKIPGLNELINSSFCGFLVEPDCPRELAQAIGELLSHPSLRKEMGENGRRLVEKKYSWKTTAAEALNFVR